MIEEIDLINSAVQNSDPEAWRHIYNSCYGAIKQTLFRYGFTGQNAEDLAQQTFSKILKAKTKPSFENVRAFYAWLICVVRTVVYDAAKSRTSSDEKQTEYLEDMDSLNIDVPQQMVLDGSVEAKIRDALGKLPEKEQKLVTMRADKTPYKRIAIETGIPMNGIRMHYKRTVEKLREYLLEEGIGL